MANLPLFREPVHPADDGKKPEEVDNFHKNTSPQKLEEGLSQAKPLLLSTPREGIPPLITTPEQLEQAALQMESVEAPIAVDTERAQGYRYGSGAYLVQLRKENVGSFLVDSYLLPDLSRLSNAMNSTWILHAADQDLVCMTELGLHPSSIFDTEIAARLIGCDRFSLGAVTEQILGISLEKSHQNEDWSKRPLPESWLSYAALDVELLPELHQELSKRLEELGRSAWAQQEFEHELSHPTQTREPSWRNLKGLGRLRRPAELAVARELWIAREAIGLREDIAPGRVLSTRGIIDAALLQPKSKRALSSIDTFRRPQAKKHVDDWWSAIQKAYELDAEDQPGRLRPDPNSIPPASTWRHSNPEAALRLAEVRELVSKVAEPFEIAPEVALEPKAQRILAWQPLEGLKKSATDLITAVENRLQESSARPWQLELLKAHLEQAREDEYPALRG